MNDTFLLSILIEKQLLISFLHDFQTLFEESIAICFTFVDRSFHKSTSFTKHYTIFIYHKISMKFRIFHFCIMTLVQSFVQSYQKRIIDTFISMLLQYVVISSEKLQITAYFNA